MTSFSLWLDHHILNHGEAFSNKTGILERYDDERIPSPYKVFGSQFKQWVTDSSVSGAIVPTSIFINGSGLNRSNNVIFDFENGRILASGIPSNALVSGSFSVKDFNIYFTNEDEEDLIVEKKYVENPRIFSQRTGAIDPYEPAVPAIFISTKNTKNEPFAFGGLDMSATNVTAVILTEDSYQLDGILSLLADTNNKVVPKISFASHPYDENGDLKNGTYSYTDLVAANSGDEPFFIEEADTSKLSDKVRKNIENNLHIGFADFKISKVRNPRI